MAETTVIHNRISNELNEFLVRMAETTEYHNKTHVVTVAIQQFKEKMEGKSQ